MTGLLESPEAPVPPALAALDAFAELVGADRRELLVHCYRMLGSAEDAEDALQDALARAWKARESYRRDVSFRAWLYRIATNACLDAAERRTRLDPVLRRPLGPFPGGLDVVADEASNPEARYDARESISIAFATVLQVLPPRQRAVLILRDVLSWHAAEVAELLEISAPAVNSALHRARTTLSRNDRYVHTFEPTAPHAHDAARSLRAVLERYLRAWEAADIPGLVALLREDAVLAMPPQLTIPGQSAIAAFFAEAIFVPGRQFRLAETEANGGPAFAIWARQADGDAYRPFTIVVLTMDRAEVGEIARIDAFRDPRLFLTFGLPDDPPSAA
jgi:RNA polymerase sigma-70 factor (ECF subfamily)